MADALARAKAAREERLAAEAEMPPGPAAEPAAPEPAAPELATAPVAEETRPAVARLRRLLESRVRVWITDGRLIYGTLGCVDLHGNLILDRAEEEKEGAAAGRSGPSRAAGVAERRQLCSVMVPGKHIKRIECDMNSLMPVETQPA